MTEAQVHVLASVPLAHAATADWIEAGIRDAVAERGLCRLVLAGGSTPRAVYRLLATSPRRDRIPWQAVEIFFGDERCVPPDDGDSNYGMIRRALLADAPVPDRAVHRIPGELGVEEATTRYAAELGLLFGDAPLVFDVVLLGMGSDGHTASLFPGDGALDVRDAPVAAARAPAPPLDRVTLTLPVLAAARAVAFLALGEGKADAVRRMLTTDDVPAALVRRDAQMVSVFLDQEAASGLS